MTKYVMKLDRQIDREMAREVSRLAPDGTRVEFVGANHSTSQRSLLWSWLSQLSLRERWEGHRLTSSEWAMLFLSEIPGARYLPSIGNPNMLVQVRPISALDKQEMSQLIDLVRNFAVEHGVTL